MVYLISIWGSGQRQKELHLSMVSSHLTGILDVLSDMIFSVLSSSKDQRPTKGKDYEIAKWEAEVRSSLAAKKAAPVTLTKQQETLVKQQLEKEANIRQKVKEIHTHLVRGLHFIRSIVVANVEEMHSYMSPIVTLLLDGALGRGSFLAGAMAFEAYLVCLLSYACLLLFTHQTGSFSLHLRSTGCLAAMDWYRNVEVS